MVEDVNEWLKSAQVFDPDHSDVRKLPGLTSDVISQKTPTVEAKKEELLEVKHEVEADHCNDTAAVDAQFEEPSVEEDGWPPGLYTHLEPIKANDKRRRWAKSMWLKFCSEQSVTPSNPPVGNNFVQFVWSRMDCGRTGQSPARIPVQKRQAYF